MQTIVERKAQEKMLDEIFGSEFDFLLDEGKNYEDAIWEHNEKPVDIKTFVEERDFLGLKGRIYPAIQYAIEKIENPDIREADLMFGKGSGKSTILQIFLVYGVYEILCMKNPQEYFELLADTPITTLLVSVSEKQAKEVGFKGAKNMIEHSPWFKGRFEAFTTEIRFEKQLNFFCGHSGASSWLGFNTVRAAMDEIEFMADTNNRSVSSQLYRALKGSLTTRFPHKYKLLCVSSPKEEDSFLYNRFKMVKKEGIQLDLPAGIDVSRRG